MKKILLYIPAILALTLVSCKKNYTCECKTDAFGFPVSVKSEAKSSKKGAEEWCKSMGNPTETVDGVSSPNTLPLTCAIK
jgi:hypothetical protein